MQEGGNMIMGGTGVDASGAVSSSSMPENGENVVVGAGKEKKLSLRRVLVIVGIALSAIGVLMGIYFFAIVPSFDERRDELALMVEDFTVEYQALVGQYDSVIGFTPVERSVARNAIFPISTDSLTVVSDAIEIVRVGLSEVDSRMSNLFLFLSITGGWRSAKENIEYVVAVMEKNIERVKMVNDFFMNIWENPNEWPKNCTTFVSQKAQSFLEEDVGLEEAIQRYGELLCFLIDAYDSNSKEGLVGGEMEIALQRQKVAQNSLLSSLDAINDVYLGTTLLLKVRNLL